MKNRIFSPLLFSAVGACIGFYLLSGAHIAIVITIILLSLTALSFFRVVNRQLKSFYCTVFTVGLVLGLFAAEAGRNVVRLGLSEEKITGIEGVLLEDPRLLVSGTTMASVSIRKAAGKNVSVSGSGDITFFFSKESDDALFTKKLRECGRGTVIFAEGKIRSNESRSNERVISFSASSLHIVKPAPAIERMRTKIRLNLMERFEDSSSESGASGKRRGFFRSEKPWGGLALALLIGIRDNLDTELTSVYRGAGLSYILALSGMHLAVITALIAFLLKKPLGLKAASITGAAIISLYCILVGPMPSLIRSAIMYLLGVLTILTALPKKSISVLCLSFLIQIIIMPAAGNSLSFILSYTAMLGILITSRHVSSLLSGIIPDFILQPLSLSCGAFLATAGICSFSFGYIAPIGIIAGLAIIPLTTIFMIGSIIWLLLDFFSVSFILNLPLTWLYRSMEIISSLASKVPGIRANAVLVIIISIIMLITIAVFDYKRKSGQLNLKPFN